MRILKMLLTGVILVLLVGCSPETAQKQAKRAATINISEIPANRTINATTNASANETMANGEGIRVRRLSDGEIAYNKRNTEEYETLREKQYSTRIDLTQVDAYNCKSAIEDLSQQMDKMVSTIRELDDDLTHKEQAVERTKQAYNDALAGNDEFDIKRKRFDYYDAENEYDALKKDDKQAHDDYDETEQTKKIVQAECTKMRSDARLKN